MSQGFASAPAALHEQLFPGGILNIFDHNDVTLAIDTPRVIRIEGGEDFEEEATLTIPPNSSVAFPIGTTFWIQSFFIDINPRIIEGAGVTLQGLTTIVGMQSGTFTLNQVHTVMLVKTATDVWDIILLSTGNYAWL